MQSVRFNAYKLEENMIRSCNISIKTSGFQWHVTNASRASVIQLDDVMVQMARDVEQAASEHI